MTDGAQDENLDILQDQYGTRDGTIFIIDASEPMFTCDAEGESFFQQCIKKYIAILLEKLVWNRKDWMGLVLFGVEEWDKVPETKYIKTLHKFSPVSVKTLKEAMTIADGKWQDYKKLATKDNYPLSDVLWHAALAFGSVKMTMPIQRVILLTCRDSPPINDDEKHSTRVRVASYYNIGLKFCVVGLGKDWKQEVFYKDLEIMCARIDEEDYQKTQLEDLVEEVKFPSRIMAALPWRLGKDVVLDVSVKSLCVKSKYLKKEKINRETNIPLFSNSRFVRDSGRFDDELMNTRDEDEEAESQDLDSAYIFPSDVRKMQTFGDRKIYFTLNEVKTLSNISEIGIDVICVKPISYSPLYHYTSPYYVTHANKGTREAKLLFAALLNKCEQQNLMIICMVTIRRHSPSNLYTMIPDETNGGFYLYCIPYKECVRDLTPVLTDFIYEDPAQSPVDGDLVALFKKILKAIKIKYDPVFFPNPKLQLQQYQLERIALDFDHGELPPDRTLPQYELMKQRLAGLITAYNEMVLADQEATEGPPAKKTKRTQNSTKGSTVSESDIIQRVRAKTVEQCTVLQLKDVLKNGNLKTSGTKSELVERIYEHYG